MNSGTNASSQRLLSGYASGLQAAFEGFAFLCRHPRLWMYGIVPCVINVAVALCVWVGGYFLADWAITSFTPELPDAWYGKLARLGIIIAALLVSFALGLIAWLLLQSVFCSYAFSLLARRVELFLGAAPEELTEVAILTSVMDALHAAFKLLVINVVVLVFHIVPGIGSLFAVALGLYVDAFVLGSEFLGYPLEQRGVRWLQRQEFARTWRGSTLGLGTIVLLMMLIPVIGAVFQATAVVGAVLIYRRINGLPVEPAAEVIAVR